ncbi:NB-ARC domain-containing protein [Accumulibacter sp.]|uniref:NB-ARC domain-containing protein n=1 Tax=Accumulibacter sp. TaxID=2053492 RepID=UPI0028C37DDF|nr:NB-ARC domain-containing protein [Accumulibacter sp.]
MGHKAIEQILCRAELAKSDSDFTYFFDLLLVAEVIAKTVTLGMVAAIRDDKDRNRYRIEHALVRADGLGDWSRALEDALSGQASQYLLSDAYPEQGELSRLTREGDWQYSSLQELKATLNRVSIAAEELPVKSDMKRWFRLLATLRNKTRGHGATKAGDLGEAAKSFRRSIDLFIENFSLFQRPWAYLHRNISGKYRVSPIAGDCSSLEYLRKEACHSFRDGVYVMWGKPHFVTLARSTPELDDFYFANGNFSARGYELLSYLRDDKLEGDSQEFSAPAGTLPESETHGNGDLQLRSNCFSNAPDSIVDYVPRPKLEGELEQLLLDDKRSIVTLRGKGGIGKTSLALVVLEKVYLSERFMTVVWLSARDVDLQLNGPKPVRPHVVSPEDMSKLYAKLVLSEKAIAEKDFSARSFFEQQLCKTDAGATLFVFDNFETTQNPLEMFTWIDTYIRLPNKALLTTRLRDFKGDYPVDVSGMTDSEARQLIEQTSAHLEITGGLEHKYIDDLVHQSEGHPYVIKILLGEIARTGKSRHIPHIVAGSDEILTALFERTYSALSPCAQRAFLTLSSWSSSVPRLVFEAVLLRSTSERQEVETGIESLLQYSLAEAHNSLTDKQEFLVLPLVASVFGKKKLNISPYKTSIQADIEILQMLGPSRRDDIHLNMSNKLERFVSGIARRVDAGGSYQDYEQILEMICRHYPQGWLSLARWHIETNSAESLDKAKQVLTRFLESEPSGRQAAEAWRQLATVCYRTGDALGEIHSFVERAQLAEVSFYDVSSTANRLNILLRGHDLNVEKEEKQALAERLLTVMEGRESEADSDDFSRMAWLAIHLGQDIRAQKHTAKGLLKDPDNFHCGRLSDRLRPV